MSEILQSTSDYRESHKYPGKGKEYDQTFSENKYRKYVWDWEKNVLKNIVRKYYDQNDNIKYLDFACGTCRIISFLEDFVSESTGVDVSDSMLDVGQGNVTKSKLIKDDITRNKIFEENNFHLITSFRFFLNAEQDLREDALNALTPLLRRDGYFVFNIHMNGSSLLARIVKLKRMLKGESRDGFRSMTVEEVHQMVEKSGLEIVKKYFMGIVPIINDNTSIPTWLIHPIDWLASELPLLRSLSRYVIYVCKPKGTL